MASIMMKSTTPTEFLCFPKLAGELRQMIWNEALPTLDIQRFNAEITRHPDRPVARDPEDLILCLAPNDDFVQLTKGYVGLLSACHESRTAAMDKIKAYLPIHYITQAQDGSAVVRFARVPYNPDGQICISGLGPALHFAADRGLGARGTSVVLRRRVLPDHLADTINCVAIPKIKNLSIALDRAGEFMGEDWAMFGWDFHSFRNLARRMAKRKLETIELVDNDWLEARHDNKNHRVSLDWLHTPAPIIRRPHVRIPWSRLLDDFTANMDVFKAVERLRASAAAEAREETS